MIKKLTILTQINIIFAETFYPSDLLGEVFDVPLSAFLCLKDRVDVFIEFTCYLLFCSDLGILLSCGAATSFDLLCKKESCKSIVTCGIFSFEQHQANMVHFKEFNIYCLH